MSVPHRPLAGVRVLDLTRLLPGAYATLLMADLGADVVKVEDPRGGDPARQMPPLSGDTSVYYTVLNRNKRSITLDLRSRASATVLDALLPQFDIVVESFRPQTSRRLGVDAATIRARHPRIIYASITGFGQNGPYAELPAHDINYESLSGLLSVRRNPAVAPEVPGMLLADIGAALNGAAGVLAALYQREKTGMGAAVDVAIHEAALSWLLFPAARELMAGAEGDPRDLPIHGRDACYNIYETADGLYLALGALETKFWSTFCARIGRPELVALQDALGERQAAVVAELRALLRTRTRAAWLELFANDEVCLTPVNDVASALRDPHITARGAVQRLDGSTWVTTPIAITDTPTDEGWNRARHVDVVPAPALGAHTDEVLEAAGIGPDERTRLRSAGVI